MAREIEGERRKAESLNLKLSYANEELQVLR